MDTDVHPDDPEVLRRLCVDIAVEAGTFALRSRRALGPGVRATHETKSSDVDPVTEFDRATEELVVRRLREERSDDSIVGEEGADHEGSSALTWHVDPIDGTVNFVYDLPLWCTSIGVLRAGEPIAGAVFVPVMGEVYSAHLGGGAAVADVHGDERPIGVSGATDLSTSLQATGFSYHRGDHRVRQAERIARVLPAVRDIRRSGSAAIDLAAVAAGRVDGYFEEFINSWDVAAGVLLVREAGGTVTAFDGTSLDVEDPAGVLATTPRLHAGLSAVVTD